MDDGPAQELLFSEEMVEDIQALKGDCAMKASPRLRAAIRGMRRQVKHLEGKTLREAWQSVTLYRPYLPPVLRNR